MVSNSTHRLNLPDRSPRLWLVCICLGMLVYFMQVTVLFPVLPLYATQRWQDVPVGFVVGAMAVGLFCFRPLMGWLIDRWGRKPVMWLGLGMMLAIVPLYVWSPTPGWLMVVRILHGISQGAFATASQTMLADLVPPERRTALLGYMGMSNTIGFSLGPLVGASVFQQFGFSSVALLMLSLTIVGFAISLPLPKRSEIFTQTAISLEKASFPWKIIFQFPVRDATLLFFTSSFLHGAIVTFLPLFVSNSAVFYSANAFVAIPVRFALGKWGSFVSARWIVSLGLLAAGVGLIGLAIAPQHLMLWSIVYGLGFGSLFPVLSAIVSLAAPAMVRGRVYSVFLAGFDGGMTLGGAGVQPLVQVLPLQTIFLLLGGIGSSVSAIAFRQFSQAKSCKNN